MTTKVSSAMQDLSDNYAFTGTVSGAGKVVQVVNVMDGAVATGASYMNNNDVIPAITEGTEWMTLAITPTNASNKLHIRVVLNLSATGTNNTFTAALFQDSTSAALAAQSQYENVTLKYVVFAFDHYMTAGTVSATTFRVRGAVNNGSVTNTFNGVSGGRINGGVMASSITITEIAV